MAMNYGGIMYFPLNVNFFDDAPIELVEAKCGLAGITAVIKCTKRKAIICCGTKSNARSLPIKQALKKKTWKR